MNPPKVCDPLAVSSTLSVRKQLGQTGTDGLTDLQKKIYNTVAERGKISREELTIRLNLTPNAMEREFAILRHCELLRSFKEGSTVYFAKFSP
jgi:predicted HTH transcriptional regulator